MKYSLRPSLIALSTMTLGVTGCSSLMLNNSFSEVDDIQVLEPSGSIDQRVSLDQAWDKTTKENFWFTSQGSQIIPYSWFTWLEVADSEDLFRSSEHMSYLGYLPVQPSQKNPAGLPIGFAMNTDKQGDAWVGMTCAACHTNQLDYKGTKFLIEGAPTLANFVLFFDRLTEAMNATNSNDEKFTRFAKNVLADDYSIQHAMQLRQSFTNMAIQIAQRQHVNALPKSYPESFTSYARLDAFGNIQNQGTAFALHDLSNKNIPNAPVSYPFLWGTHQSDVVQWNASAPNTPVVGPLSRNIGEVVGVFGGLSIDKAPWWKRLIGIKTSYSSSVDMIGLGQLETSVKALRSPQWPQNYLPPINTQKAAAGSILYQAQCSGCHQVMTREQEKDLYIAVKTPVGEIGTDPITAWNAEFHEAKTLILEGQKQLILAGDKFEAEADAISIPVNGVVGLILKEPKTALKAGLMPLGSDSKERRKSLKEYAKMHAQARDAIQQPVDDNAPYMKNGELNLDGLVYKARPLNGIWATAPYMHNGSIANLWETLQKPEDRQTSFWVGNRNFDPQVVGYVNQQAEPIGNYPSPSSKFNVLDSKGNIAMGNSNLGHNYGTDLTDEEKWQLVEYMKTL
ncbi:di-heme-cytochrome C peroxidase [Marinomonas algicola]|uniref:di-heme-cytochrome C peroxidase n=1 Tax=Marinomonas algicola TaxID=2773454 RepID=UPI001748AC87|nr:di-heme-cytochrome C peroxidase [Marinomonas algicola]